MCVFHTLNSGSSLFRLSTSVLFFFLRPESLNMYHCTKLTHNFCFWKIVFNHYQCYFYRSSQCINHFIALVSCWSWLNRRTISYWLGFFSRAPTCSRFSSVHELLSSFLHFSKDLLCFFFFFFRKFQFSLWNTAWRTKLNY